MVKESLLWVYVYIYMGMHIFMYIYIKYRLWRVYKTQPNGIRMLQKFCYMFNFFFFELGNFSSCDPMNRGNDIHGAMERLTRSPLSLYEWGVLWRVPRYQQSHWSAQPHSGWHPTSQQSSPELTINSLSFIQDVGQWMILHMFRSTITERYIRWWG